MLTAAGFVKKDGSPSPNAAAVASGRPHMLRDIGRGRSRTTRADSLAALAEVLGQPMEKVAAALGLPNLPASGDRVESIPRGPIHIGPGAVLTVRHEVQAGHWLEIDGTAQEDPAQGAPLVADPRFKPARQWLERVRGDSADVYFPPGALLHVVDAVEIGYTPRDGDFVVVQRTREQGGLRERTVKQVHAKGGEIQLWPRSRNPKWASPLALDGDEDDTQIQIVGLVIGGYLPVQR